MLEMMRKNGLTLALFALGCTAFVAFTHSLTRDTIIEQEQAQLLRVLDELLPADSHDEPLFDHCVMLSSEQFLGTSDPLPVFTAMKDGQPQSYAIEAVAPDGYSGEIKLVVGVKVDGTLNGVRVLNHNETPGLGDKIELKKSPWVLDFNGQSMLGEEDTRWAVRSDGGQFDAFTGATITPRAVVKAVHKVLLLVNQQPRLLTQAPSCGESL
ncbi:electron transport complex subunit RsxG [Oceanisphaera arctica]|uniref:Ion-translocating oxidoreductase complex subunit G n=1 Tax=Oceanisphaera arctica TaxID=641510 RepID=A0A2P5TIJ6_9GAMM|nr:electron transport complex subunit RsxG [Oceanisphaera arctica]PPL14606.1 electron transport complex subunit RsxG [Oceanisphaera arctica]GHA09963.1 electron transport complex subunit G [Oceanisphaera arctica]